MYQELSLSVKMKREGDSTAYQVTEQAFQTPLMRGVNHARRAGVGKGVLYYGGLADGEAEDDK
jgi:hypothetical protein